MMHQRIALEQWTRQKLQAGSKMTKRRGGEEELELRQKWDRTPSRVERPPPPAAHQLHQSSSSSTAILPRSSPRIAANTFIGGGLAQGTPPGWVRSYPPVSQSLRAGVCTTYSIPLLSLQSIFKRHSSIRDSPTGKTKSKYPSGHALFQRRLPWFGGWMLHTPSKYLS
jgi:hypothetical protein